MAGSSKKSAEMSKAMEDTSEAGTFSERSASTSSTQTEAAKLAYVLRKMLPMEWSVYQKKNEMKMSYPPLGIMGSCNVNIAFPRSLHVYINDKKLHEFHEVFKSITVHRHFEGKLSTEYIIQLMKNLINLGFGKSTRKNLAVMGTRKRKMTLPVKNKPNIAFQVDYDEIM